MAKFSLEIETANGVWEWESLLWSDVLAKLPAFRDVQTVSIERHADCPTVDELEDLIP